MEDPSLSPLADDSDPIPQIQQRVEKDGNQVIANLSGGNAINKVDGNVFISNYKNYYREDLQIPIDSTESVEIDQLPCPYRGLFNFEPEDAKYFFGRASFVKELVQATQTRNFIPLLGASGSGKSSVVLAGLVPKLQEIGHWKFTHFRPGAGEDPFHAMALALVPLYTPELNATERIYQARQLADYFREGTVPLADVFATIRQNFPTDRVLLIADQFEELYTSCADEAIRRNFIDKLIAGIAVPSAQKSFAPVFVATMRVDFLGNALAYRPFADVLQNGDLKLGPMNRSELTEIIEKPAKMLEVAFEAGLIKRILDDVDKELGILPLLEFALTELWKRRSNKQLTHAAYGEIGGVQGALDLRANQEYAKFSEVDRERVRRIFIQLVRPGEGVEDTRRIATKAELGEESWSLVGELATARLVVTNRNAGGQETVEIVHEALIRSWGELRGWMEVDRVFRAWQEQMRGAMRQWQGTKEDVDSLLRGAALAEAEEQLRQRPEDLRRELDFIQQSLQERERLQQAETARRQRETNISRGIVVGSLMAAMVSIGLGGMAWQQSQQAKLNEADALALSSLSLVKEGKVLDAFIQGIRAGKILQNQQAVNPSGLNALQEALNHKTDYKQLEGHQEGVNNVSFSPDGKILVTGSDDKTIKLWNVDTGQEIRTIQGHQGEVKSVSFSPDGKTLATSSDDKMIKLWNVDTGQEIRTIQGHQGEVKSVSFSPDGKTLATSSGDDTVKIWNIITGQEIRTLQVQFSNGSVSFSPDGKILATDSSDTIKLWNINTGQEIRTIQGHQQGVKSMSFSPDGKTLATGSYGKTIKIWNVDTGQKIRTIQGHQGEVKSVSFSPDGKTLATGSNDTIKIWNVDTGQEIRTIQENVNSVSFSPDGKILASGSNDNTIKLWDINTVGEIRTLHGHQADVTSVSFSPDVKTLATGSYDAMIKIWNVDTGKEIRTLYGHKAGVTSVSFSPDGKTLATSSGDYTVKLWNIYTGQEIRAFQGHQSAFHSVSFSPDGKSLATGSGDNTVKLWNIDTGQEIRTLQGRQEGFTSTRSVSFSPDGKILATGSNDNTVKLWNIATGQKIRTLQGRQEGFTSISSVSFSPDGKTLATGSNGSNVNTVELWNINTGQEIRTLHGNPAGVNSVSFSPDGEILATVSSNNTVKLWNRMTGWDLDTLMGRSCDWVRPYLESNHVSESDRHLCDGIGTKKQ